MKFTIAILAVLIIGSNAQLLGNLANSITATTQANGLLNTFLGQVNQVVASNNQNINQQAQAVFSTIQALLNGALATTPVQLSASEVAELTTTVASALASLTINTTSVTIQATAVLNGIGSQISSTVNPYITALGAQILSGALKLKCFTDKVPEINGKIADVVVSTQSNLTSAVVGVFNNIIANNVPAIQSISNDITTAIQTGVLPVVS